MDNSSDTPQDDRIAGPRAGDELDGPCEEFSEPSGHLRQVVDGDPADSVVLDRANDVGTPVDGIDPDD